MKTIASFSLTIILVVGVLASAYVVQPVRAQEMIYIRADGSIEPSTVPIQRDGDLYTFTENITDYDGIMVERDNIVLDGARHLFDGRERTFDNGVTLEGRENVTIRNMTICRFGGRCIYLNSSSYNFILANDIASNSRYGGALLLESSSNNLISGNNVTGSYQYYDGICLSSSSNNNSIIENNIRWHDQAGVGLHSSSNNIISGNNITDNGRYGGGGIFLDFSYNNTISGNNIANNEGGIEYPNGGICLYASNNNSISENNVTDNEAGISLESSSNNKVYHSNFVDNAQQVDSFNSTNVWDDGYPSGGNYWSDYNGTDSDHDGIGDTPYVIDDGNRDNYPLVHPWNGSIMPSTHLILQPQDYVTRFMRTFTVNVSIANVTNLYGYEFKVHWNETLLDLIDVKISQPEAWGSNYIVVKNNVSDSTYWHSLSALAPAPAFNGSTTLVSLTFNVTYTSALQSLYNSTVETYVTFDESILADTSAHAIAHYTSNCRAQILLVMRGDLNGDKAVNILDVVKVAVIYGQIGTPGWKIEDINCDGRITILDIVLVTTNYGKKV